MNKLFSSLVLALVLSFPAQAMAGWKIVQKDTVKGKTADSILLMENNRFRAEAAAQDLVTIIDVSSDRLVIVDYGKKQYAQKRLSEFTGELRAMIESVKRLKKELPKELASQIPDPSDNFKMDFKATGKQETISTFKAAEFTAVDGQGRDAGTVWLSKDGKMGKLHKDLMTFTKAMGQELAMLTPVISMAQENGFPVKSHLLQGDTYVDSLVTSVTEQAMDSSLFQVPTAFKEVDFATFFPAPVPTVTTVKTGK